MKCPGCNYTEDIREEINIDMDGTKILYYRCKDCGLNWENGDLK